MRQVILEDVGKIRFLEVPVPEVKPGKVLIRILRCGVCGTDVHNYYLETIFGKDRYPFHIGHEICGIVSAAGEGVASAAPGDVVVMNPFWTCNSCEPCRMGRNNHCEHLDTIGLHGPGGYSEYTLAPASAVIRVGRDAKIDELTFSEPLGTIVYGAEKLRLSPECDVLVIGTGPIGLLFLQFLKAHPLRSVTVSGIDERGLALAEKLGAGRTVNALRERDHALYDVVIDCTGNAGVAQDTVSMMKFGGQILIFGVCPSDDTVTWHPFTLYQKDISVHTTFALTNAAFQKAVHLILSRTVDVRPLIAGIRPVDELESCIRDIHDGRVVGKILIDPQRK